MLLYASHLPPLSIQAVFTYTHDAKHKHPHTHYVFKHHKLSTTCRVDSRYTPISPSCLNWDEGLRITAAPLNSF